MPSLYRRHPDSSYLREPRIFARVLCDPGKLVDTVRFYHKLTAHVLDMDMAIPEAGLHVVALGPFLIIEMDRAKLDRAAQATRTHISVLCADLDRTAGRQIAAGAVVEEQKWSSPPGPGIRLRHPDGNLVEYLEHRSGPYDVDKPQPALREFTDANQA